ncbi:MAG: hypothetical protein A4E56_00402 [Pelotomaculum sp. PtaU1.Bin065]|nr:MAG: hypothetical protein A4E56_00402 [Pelotomaculum sp. PtaU1.Bin065]
MLNKMSKVKMSFKKTGNRLVASLIKRVISTQAILSNEKGELKAMAWTIGSAVVVVLIIVVFMTLAPDTAEDIWDSFVDYMNDAFGF